VLYQAMNWLYLGTTNRESLIRLFDRYDIVNEADLRAAVGKLAGISAGTEKGQSSGAGRVASFMRARK
jgi:hypothetical protein